LDLSKDATFVSWIDFLNFTMYSTFHSVLHGTQRKLLSPTCLKIIIFNGTCRSRMRRPESSPSG